MFRYLIIPFLLLAASCSYPTSTLALYTEAVDFTELASYHIQTPDPRLDCPDYGQRLHVTWYVENLNESTEIRVRLRFKNLTEVEWVTPVQNFRGMSTYCLFNQDYESTGGILSYKAVLVQDGLILQEETHALWTELILF